MKKDIRDIPLKELERQIILMGEPPHRARQIFAWLNRKNAGAFSEMTDLPRGLITRLEEKFVIGTLACEKRLIARDGTEKFLWRLADGRHVETVFIRSGKRATVCLSTQVGCRFACPFCASGMRGFKRNLTSGEIVEQLLLTQRSRGDRVTNVVFMGMGEPLDNYDNLIQAIRTINDPKGLNIGARKITISTCGIIPGILKLKDLGLQVELSVSLHAADDALRNELVPVNRKYPIGELVEALREYYESTNRVITLEYTLIKDKNDSLKNADKLAKIAKTLRAKVNIITYNPFAESSCGKTDRRKMELFRDRLRSKGVTATVRSPRGQDIMAACGQLAAKGKRHEV
jgi:23S rRNA (adenine2503-C2)-methyltransferase